MNAAESIDINDDLLTELLLRLPPKSIFRFISVSKRWRHIINDPFFLRSYSKLRRSSGDGRLLALFQTKPMLRADLKDPLQMNILPIPGIRQPNIRNEHVPRRGLGSFINSSNGLILCTVHLVRSDVVVTLYNVLNPVTRKFVSLPPPPPTLQCYNPYYFPNDGLMCEENTAALTPNFIVVRVCRVKYNSMQIETYSSKTGEWAPSTLVAASINFGEPLSPPVVVNGVFHWFITRYNLAVYDPNRNKNHLQLIDAPCSSPGDCSSVIVTRSPDDILWYGSILKTGLKFWKLEKGGDDDDDDGSYKRDTAIGRDEWILMHDISLESLCRDVVIDWSKACFFSEFIFYDAGVGFDGVVSRDPLVVLLKKKETWFLYNFETKTVQSVPYHGRLLTGDYYSGTLSPFLESSFLSSYAL